MQSDINKIFKWCETWSMELECKVERCKDERCKEGNNQFQRIISLQEKRLSVIECERNLGSLVSSDSTWHELVNSAGSSANPISGINKEKI